MPTIEEVKSLMEILDGNEKFMSFTESQKELVISTSINDIESYAEGLRYDADIVARQVLFRTSPEYRDMMALKEQGVERYSVTDVSVTFSGSHSFISASALERLHHLNPSIHRARVGRLK